MVRQEPWSMAEAALLLEATIKYKAGELTRSEAVSSVSTQLRQMAQNKGQVIDKIYRNLNGINFQMASMESALAGHTIMKPATRLFEEAVSLYRSDPREYHRILSEAKAVAVSTFKTNEQVFMDWLSSRIDADQISEYVILYKEIEDFCRKRGILQQPLFEIQDYSTAKAVKKAVESNRVFRFFHKHKMSKYSAAVMQYCSFIYERSKTGISASQPVTVTLHDLEETETAAMVQPTARNDEVKSEPAIEQKTITSHSGLNPTEQQRTEAVTATPTKPSIEQREGEANTENTIAVSESAVASCDPEENTRLVQNANDSSSPEIRVQGQAEILIVDFDKNETYSFTKPVSFSYFGEVNYESSWKNLYVKVCKLLFEDNPNVFSGLRDYFRSGDRRYLISDSDTAIQLAAPAEIADGFYVETKRSATELIRNIGMLLDSCHVDYENLIIRYVRCETVIPTQTEPIKSAPFTEAVGEASENQEKKTTSESVLPGKAGQDAFRTWLQKRGMTDGAIRANLSALSGIEEYAANMELISGIIYDITSPAELGRIWDILNNCTAFISYKKRNSATAFAFKKYLDFRTEEEKKRASIPSTSVVQIPSVESKICGIPPRQVTKETSVLKRGSTHLGRSEFEDWLRAANVPAGTIKTYADSVAYIGQFLLEKGLEDRNIYSIRGITRLEGIRGLILESKEYASTRTGGTISLDLYALKKYIKFRKKDSSGQLNEEAERFAGILRENFENGFRLSSMIDRNRFKQYYEDQYGAAPSMTDEEIVNNLQQIGMLQEGRVFFREGSAYSDLLDDIQAEIMHTLKNGASYIFTSELFERYQQELAEQLQVYRQDALKELLLASSYGEYLADKNGFFIRGVTPNADEDIRKLMRQSPTPMTYDDIHQRLWYIPLDTIKHCLVTSVGMVNVAQETYFYAPNLPINTEELNQIAELLHRELSQKSFVTGLEMRTLINNSFPSVAINIGDFSHWGLRNCLSVLLGDRFSFVGPIISEKGMALNTSQVFAEFSRSHDLMTLDELKAFAKEINEGIIYWDSVMDVMVRISQNEFVPKGKIGFDVNATDDVLDRFLDGDYAPIKSFKLFLHFPAVGVQWNEYLLESYVAGYSRSFSLMHASYTAADCCGGIVRKSSAIKDFQGLITDVLAHSEAWKTKNDALDLLVKRGYLQRRHYAKIEKIVFEANLLREKNRTEGTT